MTAHLRLVEPVEPRDLEAELHQWQDRARAAMKCADAAKYALSVHLLTGSGSPLRACIASAMLAFLAGIVLGGLIS